MFMKFIDEISEIADKFTETSRAVKKALSYFLRIFFL